MSDPIIALSMLGIFLFIILLGFPVAFTLMAMGIMFGYYAYFEPDRMWRAYDKLGFLKYSFVETVEAMHWPYVIRATGGLLFVIGGLLMAYNVWRTIRGDESVDVADQPSVAAAPEVRLGTLAAPAE